MNRNDQDFIIRKIRTQYTVKQHSELDELKALDRRVKRPASIFAYILGSISALIMGSGMSLVMSDIAAILGIANALPVGIATGVIGMMMAIVNYPIYKGILNSRRKKYADKIITRSDRIVKGEHIL